MEAEGSGFRDVPVVWGCPVPDFGPHVHVFSWFKGGLRRRVDGMMVGVLDGSRRLLSGGPLNYQQPPLSG